MSPLQYIALKLLIVVFVLNTIDFGQAVGQENREVILRLRGQESECRFMLPNQTAQQLADTAGQNTSSSSVIKLLPLFEEKSSSGSGNSSMSTSGNGTHNPSPSPGPPFKPIGCAPCIPPVKVVYNVVYQSRFQSDSKAISNAYSGKIWAWDGLSSRNLNSLFQFRLQLDSKTIAEIYLGKIKKWNDSSIRKLNPDVQLPNMKIVVVHAEPGCSTALFTDYLSQVSSKWHSTVGSGADVNWPVKQLGGRGDDGVLKTVRETPGSIGFLGSNIALRENVGTIELIPDPKYDILKAKWLKHP